MRVLVVAPGSPEHGVARHARVVAGLLGTAGADVVLTADLDRVHQGRDVVHAHFTDALFGPTASDAATRFVAWAQGVVPPVVVTLHDVPGLDPDRARDRRRSEAYARVVAAVDGVVVSADHEADAVALLGAQASVVPLPVEPLADAGPAPAWAGRTTVGVLGFLYPGKGHDRAVGLLEELGRGDVTVVAIGGPSPGHEDLVDDLRVQAHRARVPLVVTGPLSEADLHAAALAVTVPLAAYRTLGASGSVATWLAAGRRPLVGASAHSRALEARWPGALLIGDSASALGAALADPGRTWRAGDPPRPDVASAHLAAFAQVRR